MEAAGIDRGEATALAKASEDETDAERLARARSEMDDEEKARYERVVKEQRDLQNALEKSRERVGVDTHDLQRVVGAALARAGLSLDSTRGETVGKAATFKFDPDHLAFAKEAGWQDTFDDLRVRPRKRGERINEWRKKAPIRAIAFEPPRLPARRDAPEAVQVHLAHRLVRPPLSRFISQASPSGLSRVPILQSPPAP